VRYNSVSVIQTNISTQLLYIENNIVNISYILHTLCRISTACTNTTDPSGRAAARLLELRVRIPPETWTSLCCECCGLPGRGLCDGLNTRPEESYRIRCIFYFILFYFIYYTDSRYKVYKDKLQNCSRNQFHCIGTCNQVETNSMTNNRGGNKGSEK